MADASYTAVGGSLAGGDATVLVLKSYTAVGGLISGGRFLIGTSIEPKHRVYASSGGTISGGVSIVGVRNDLLVSSVGGVIAGGISFRYVFSNFAASSGTVSGGESTVYLNTVPPPLATVTPIIRRAQYRRFTHIVTPLNEELV